MKIPRPVPLLKSLLLGSLFSTLTAFSPDASAKLMEGGVDPENLGKGDWIWSVSISTNKLNGQVPGVTDIPSLMSFERNQGMNFIIVKAGTGSTNYPAGGSQFTSNLVYQAHLQGLKIFAYTRSYGDDIPGEIALAKNCLALGADGFVWDAESEWESSRQGTQGPAKAIQLLSEMRNAYPNRFMAHAPLPYISLHSSFPYKEFGYYCDAVMPQDYWNYIGVTPAQMVADMDTQWRNFHNSLSGQWTNAIKPIAPIGQADITNVPNSEITAFNDAVKNDANPVTPGGYKGISWWDAHQHSATQWNAIGATSIGDAPAVADVIVDNSAATLVGSWTLGTSSADKYAADYRSKGQGTGAAYLQFTPSIAVSGNYRVFEWHPKGSNRTTNAPVVVSYNGGSTTVRVNQQINGGSWVYLGTYNFLAGTSGSVKIADNFADAGQLVMADAVKFSYVISAPAAPSGLSAVPVSGPAITLSWADNSADELSFSILRSTTAGGPFTEIATVSANTTSYADTQVAASTTYYYVIRAINQGGSSDSSQASATSAAEVADIIVDNPSATLTGTWTVGTASADKFGTDYRYKGQGTGAAYATYSPTILTPGNYNVYEWHPMGANRSAGTPHIITHSSGSTTINVNQQINGGKWNSLGSFHFNAGTGASVKITDAFADAGNLAMADAVKFSFGLVAPDAPSDLSATAVSASQIDLSWTDNANNEDTFVIGRSSTSGGPFTDIAIRGADTTSYSDVGLAASSSYYYVVRATNAGGSSANSAQANATTLPTLPTAPSGLSAVAVTASRVDLAWADNASNETSYVIARSTVSGGPYSDIATLGVNSTAYSNTGLAAGTTYYYVVRAVNAAGSASSTQASATTPSAPPAPTGLTATTAGSGQVNLSWSDVAGETGYVLARSSTSGGPYSDIANLAANAVSYSNTGLAANSTYYYVVRATNSIGSSANSAQASATTFPTPPAAPGGLTATAVSSSQINLAWTDNSPNETSVIVSRSTTSGGPYTQIATLAANSTAYSNTGLAANTTYYYVVRAENAGGTSLNSNQATATTAPNIPAAPGSLTASALSSSAIKLAWADNSSNESNFIVARSTTSGGPYTDVATLGANVTVYTNSALTANTTYYYVVRASNAGGASANSAQASATTLATIPAAPSALTAAALSSTSIKLTWSDNSSNESNFIVARASTSGGPYTDIATLAANVTVYTNTALKGSTTYYYVVRASNASGASANSAQASATTQPVADIIVDNPAATVTGTWSSGTASADKYGTDYRFKGQGTGASYLTFTPSIQVSGNYQVYEYHPQGSNRTTNAPIVISYSGGTRTNFVNQKINGGTWVALGAPVNLAAGTAGYVRITDKIPDAGQSVMADAIKFVYVP